MKNSGIFILLLFMLFVSACEKPEIIVFKKSKLKQIKTVVINKIEIHSLNYDPFIKNDIEKLLKFELQKNGYILVNTSTTNANSPATPDAFINLLLMHRKYYEEIKEINNITFNLDFFSSLEPEEKICSVIYSHTDDENLINTQYLQKLIDKMINTIKKEIE